MVLPRQSGSLALRVGEVLGGEQLAQVDLLALRVGQLDADGVAARHDGDARRDRAHRAGDVVGEPDHARRLDAGRGLELVERDDRAGTRVDDLAADAEIVEHAFERGRRSPGCIARLIVVRSDAFGAVSRPSGGSS